eukprot:365637-Chlamydomonas_euryale.AAC.4
MRLTPPRRARRRIAGLVMPWMLSRSTLRWRLAPPLPRPLPPLPRPDMAAGVGGGGKEGLSWECPSMCRAAFLTATCCAAPFSWSCRSGCFRGAEGSVESLSSWISSTQQLRAALTARSRAILGTRRRSFTASPSAFAPKHQVPWPAPSRPPASPPVARPRASSWPQRQRASRPPPPAVSRSPTVTVPALWRCARFASTRRALSCSSGSCRFSASSVRLRRTSRPICASSRPPCWRCRRPPRLTWSACSRTPTLRPSTPSASPSCPRTSSLRAASVASARKRTHAAAH